MSETLKHECGIAFIRLLKPLEFYYKKYGTPFYALNKLYLLMEKQHNRGHDGAGIACIKLDMPPGVKYISIEKDNSVDPIKRIFLTIFSELQERLNDKKDARDVTEITQWLKHNARFCGELFLGHLRYGTYGKNNIETCHPHLRENNWMSRNLVLAGNFNLPNVDQLFSLLLDIGQHPKDKSDTITILEKLGHFLDEENKRLFEIYKSQNLSGREIAELIIKNLDVLRILRNACKKWDGGYLVAGLIGHGDAFIIRDPSGIRPGFFYKDEEVFVAASERPSIQTAFNVNAEDVREIEPGTAVIMKKDGEFIQGEFSKKLPKKPCSFERIYFSRGNDADIYKERKALGKYVTEDVLKAINYDIYNTVFSFIPNTAEVCFYGMIEELHHYCNKIKAKRIMDAKENLDEKALEKILSLSPRMEKVAVKDIKLRTFITNDNQRDDLVTHVYDITYNTLSRNKDSLVVIDDSIVRGTTLKQSILRILDRLGPKEIIVVSSAPQIRYPDCYGIDMAKIGDFIAFRAAIALLKERGMEEIIDEVYKKCKEQETLSDEKMVNHVKKIYKPFSPEEISDKMAELLRPKEINAGVKFVFQRIENLHKACPNHKGDWYFTGDYPTPGGFRVVNRSFILYMEGKNERAY